MSITKSNILKKITQETSVSVETGSNILTSFLLTIKTQSKIGPVKLSGFGTFNFKKTPKRIGRNPKTKDSYIIHKRNKLNFKPSNILKGKLNP